MNSPITRLMVLINHIIKDLEKLAIVLQEPEIVAIVGLENSPILDKEDYE